MLGTQEQRTEGMKKQTQELIELAYNRGYTAGLNVAWEASKKICSDEGFTLDEINTIFHHRHVGSIFIEYSASEAIKKIKEYEKKKYEEEQEIRVGDEVILNLNYEPNTKAIVIANDNSARYPYNVMVDNGDTEWVDRDTIDRKTGRTFPEITEVLEKLKEGNNG